VQAAESAASAALSLLKQDKSEEDKKASKNLNSDHSQQRKPLEENVSLHPGTLFQHFRTNAQNQQAVNHPSGNMHSNQPSK